MPATKPIKPLFVSLCLALFAVGSASAPSIPEGPDRELSFDGLVRVKHSQFTRAWVDPDIDLSRYTKIMGGGAQFQFRAVRKPPSTEAGRMSSRSGEKGFPISDANRTKLIDIVNETFEQELAKSTRYTMVEEKGDDVLMIRGAMLDIVSFVPPQQVGRTEVFLSSVGEITLVLELVDSVSGEVLARAAERRNLETQGGTMRSTPVTNWSQVRRLARTWANRLRKGIDEFPINPGSNTDE